MSIHDIEFKVVVGRCDAPETSALKFDPVMGRYVSSPPTTRIFVGTTVGMLDFVPSCGMEIGDFKIVRVKMKGDGFLVHVSSRFCEDPCADYYPKQMFSSWEDQMEAIQAQQFIDGLKPWSFVETTPQGEN